MPRALNWKSLGRPPKRQIEKLFNIRVQGDDFSKRYFGWPEPPKLGRQRRSPEPPFYVSFLMLHTVDNIAVVKDALRNANFGLRRIREKPRL